MTRGDLGKKIEERLVAPLPEWWGREKEYSMDKKQDRSQRFAEITEDNLSSKGISRDSVVESALTYDEQRIVQTARIASSPDNDLLLRIIDRLVNEVYNLNEMLDDIYGR